MGTRTPNMSIYIPAAGETNYDASFASGMFNIDQHDHSGGPNKGVRINSSGIDDFSITYQKLNANVVDTATGLAVDIANPNKIQIAGLLRSIHGLTTDGFISKNGTAANARTMTGTVNEINVSNGDGVSGNPTFSLAQNFIGTLNGTSNQISVVTGTNTATLSLGPTVSLTSQPGLIARRTTTQAGVTGDNTSYPVDFGPIPVYDPTNSYNPGAKNWLVPATGLYYIGVNLSFSGIDPALHTFGFVDISVLDPSIPSTTTFRGYNCNFSATRSSAGGLQLPFGQVFKLNQNDVVFVVALVQGGPKSINITESILSIIKIW